MCAYVEPTTQVPTSVHFWADAHGWRDREGELERQGRGGKGRRDGLLPFTLSSFTAMIQPRWMKTKANLKNEKLCLAPLVDLE